MGTDTPASPHDQSARARVGVPGSSSVAPGAVLIRDTKNHGTGPVLRVTPANWKQFTASLKR